MKKERLVSLAQTSNARNLNQFSNQKLKSSELQKIKGGEDKDLLDIVIEDLIGN